MQSDQPPDKHDVFRVAEDPSSMSRRGMNARAGRYSSSTGTPWAVGHARQAEPRWDMQARLIPARSNIEGRVGLLVNPIENGEIGAVGLRAHAKARSLTRELLRMEVSYGNLPRQPADLEKLEGWHG